MPLLDEYDNRYTAVPEEPAKKILFTVVNDIFSRGGLDHSWDEIDDEVKEEILQTNLENIQKNLL